MTMTYFSAVVTHDVLHRFRGDEMMEAVVQRQRTTLSTKNPELLAVILGYIVLGKAFSAFLPQKSQSCRLISGERRLDGFEYRALVR